MFDFNQIFSSLLILIVSGKYIHMDASNEDKTRHIVSLPVTGSGCLHFFYHMFGAQVGKLYLVQRYQKGTETMRNIVFQKSGKTCD